LGLELVAGFSGQRQLPLTVALLQEIQGRPSWGFCFLHEAKTGHHSLSGDGALKMVVNVGKGCPVLKDQEKLVAQGKSTGLGIQGGFNR